MPKLFEILDGIVSSDHVESTLGSVDEIVSYAESCGENISYADAKRIAEVGKHWLHEQQHGNGEWNRMRHEAMRALDDQSV